MASEIEQYIRQAAAARGIDPDVAVRVAKSEGGLRDPFRHGEGPAPKSQLPAFGNREHSIGPFQLYISGNNAGLGDRALAAGIDPRKDWRGGIDFALNEAAQKGWGQWYGAKNTGISNFQGIGGNAKGLTINSSPVNKSAPGGVQALQLAGRDPVDTPVAANPNDAWSGMRGADVAGASPVDVFKSDGFKAGMQALGDNKTFGGGLGLLAAGMGGSQPQEDQIIQTGALQGAENADAGRMQAAQQLMSTLMAGRPQRRLGVQGMSLMG